MHTFEHAFCVHIIIVKYAFHQYGFLSYGFDARKIHVWIEICLYTSLYDKHASCDTAVNYAQDNAHKKKKNKYNEYYVSD